MRQFLVAIFAVISIVTTTPSAEAGAITYSGTTAGSPTWNRPVSGNPPTPPLSGVGTLVAYDVQPFYVTGTATFEFLSLATSPSNWDNYTFLYQNSFNPLTPFTNVLIGNDDFPSVGRSGFSYSLNSGTQYFLVTTGFANTDSGSFTNTISSRCRLHPGPWYDRYDP